MPAIDVNETAVERAGVLKSPLEPVAKLSLPPRRAREARPAAIGRIAGGRVEQDLFESTGVEARAQLMGGIFVGRGIFDGGEAGLGRRVEAFEKGLLREEPFQVCAQAWHDRTPRLSRPGGGRATGRALIPRIP